MFEIENGVVDMTQTGDMCSTGQEAGIVKEQQHIRFFQPEGNQ